MRIIRSLLKISFLVFVSFSSSFAQQKTKKIELIGADDLQFDSHISGARRLIGNVSFKHENSIMYCDSAYLYDESNTLDAFGNVRISQPGAMTVYGDKLNYDGNTKMAIIRENIRMQDKDAQLVTDMIYYDLGKSVAYYLTGGKIISKDNTLTSRYGYYYPDSKEFHFKKDVVLTNPQYTMNCDTLKYNTASKTAYFLGPTTIKTTDNIIYCENGWYDTQKDVARFSRNTRITGKEQEMRTDSLFYDSKLKYGRAYRNIELIDTAENSIVSGNYGEYWEESGSSVITGNAILTQMYENDTLYLHADTLKAGYEEDLIVKKKTEMKKEKREKRRERKNEKEKEEEEIRAKTHPADTTKHKILLAYNHVKFFKADFQGKCDSLSYTYRDSAMRLFGEPVLWSDSSQLTGENVRIMISNGKINTLYIDHLAFIASQEDSAKYNQIKGRKMTGYFVNNQLDKIKVEGNGETIYYATDNKEIIGVNKAECSDLMIYVKENKVDRVTFIKKPVAVLLPLKDTNPKELVLKGFQWHENHRPYSKKDIFIW